MLKRHINAILFAAAAFVLMAASSDADPSASFTVAATPGSSTVAVDLVVVSGDSVSDTQFTIDYDSAKLAYQSVEVGAAIDGDFEIGNVNADCCTSYPPDTGRKRVLVQVLSTHWTHFYTGTVAIARLVFSKVACGSSSLVLPNITALNHATTVSLFPIYDPSPLTGDTVEFSCGSGCPEPPCDLDKATHADSVGVAPATWTAVRRVFQ